VEAGKIVTFPPIQEPPLPEVNIAKAQKGPKRDFPGSFLQPTPQSNPPALELLRTSIQVAIQSNPSFPIGVTVVLFDKHFN
jgi:hypothetical protein